MNQLTTMTPAARNVCRVVGITLLVVGLVLFGIAFMSPFRAFGDMQGPGDGFDAMGRMALFGFLGVLCIGIGGFLTKLGFLQVAADIVATETSGAVEHSSGAFGRGLGGGLKAAGFSLGGTQQVVKVKCRKCGHLETEDATFCSKCGKKV